MPHHASAISDLDKEIANSDSDTDTESDSASDLDELSGCSVETKRIQNSVPVPTIPTLRSNIISTTSNQISAPHNQPYTSGLPIPTHWPQKKPQAGSAQVADSEYLRASILSDSMKVLLDTISDVNVDEEIRIAAKGVLCKCILAL